MAKKTIAVLGGGSAGFTAARTACVAGANVLFFMGDNADYASLCINAGCMPSKAMFEPIDTAHHAQRHGWWKVEPRNPDQLLAEIVRWKDREIAGFRDYRNGEIEELVSENFKIIRGHGRFVSGHEIEGAGQRYTFDAAIIATGSNAVIPKIEGLDPAQDGIWTNEEILHNTKLPESLVVLGAGPVGLEFSLRYARLGTRVTLISKSRILPRHPSPFGERLAIIYEHEDIHLLLGRQVTRVRRGHDGIFNLEVDGGGADDTTRGDRILCATGRQPAVAQLGLEALGLGLENGRLKIGEDMRVDGQSQIFAAGDVTGQRMVVHHAHIEAGIAAENAVDDGDRKWTKRSNLFVIFSDPEFAFAGCRPEQAEAEGIRIASARAESRDIGKLHLAGDDFGFGEFYADTKTGRLIGAGLLCDDASNLIHLPAYAIDHQHTVHQLEDAEFYHPTKMEIVSEIGDALCRKLGGHPFARAEE